MNPRFVIVGGHSRNAGKTTLVESLLHGLPEFRWTAVKLTRLSGQRCGDHDKACTCAVGVGDTDLLEETCHTAATDTSRYLAAGARRALWLRSRERALGDAWERLQSACAHDRALVVESNSLMRFAVPDLFLVALDPRIPDFKPSARNVLSRADALVVAVPLTPWPWRELDPGVIAGKPVFLAAPAPPAGLIAWVRERLAGLD